MKPLFSLITLATLAGCASPGPASVGIANPASEYCVKLGGQLQIERTPAGEVGICLLPDGTRMEEWALFRRDHPAPRSGS